MNLRSLAFLRPVQYFVLKVALIFYLSIAPTNAESASAPIVTNLNPIAEGSVMPVGILVDSNGNIYSSDPQGGGILKYDSNGKLIRKYPAAQNGKGLAFAQNGELLITNETTVVRLDVNSGSVLGTFGNFVKAVGVAVDASGSIYVTDNADNCVQKFDLNFNPILIQGSKPGKPSNSFGTAGSLNGQFNGPVGITYEKVTGQLAIADSGNGRVQFFSQDGSWASNLGSYGSGPLKFTEPKRIVVEYSGAVARRFYVVDSYQKNIQVIDAATKTFKTYLGGPSELGTPSDIQFSNIDPLAPVLLVASELNKIVRFGIDSLLPVNVQVQPATVAGQLTIAWINPSIPTFSGVNIYKSTTIGTLGDKIGSNVVGTSYVSTELDPDTDYYFTVRGVDLSLAETTNTDQHSESKFTLIVSKSGIGTISTNTGTLVWNASVGSAIYEQGTTVSLSASMAVGTSVSWSGCENSTATTCTLTMNSSKNISANFFISIPTSPIGVAALVPTVNNQLTLSWTNPVDNDFSHIHVYRSKFINVLGDLVKDNLTDSGWTDTNLDSYTNYFYTVRSVNSIGNESTNSNQVSQLTLDSTSPVASISVPTASSTPTINVSLFATDNTGIVTSYCISEINNKSSCSWTDLPPTNYTFTDVQPFVATNKTLYAFVRDSAGNTSPVVSATVSLYLTVDSILTVNTSGAGTVNSTTDAIFSCDSNTCSKSFPYGAYVNLVATASNTSTFSGWSGDCTGSGPCSIYLDANKIVYAIFTGTKPFRINGNDHAYLNGAYIDALDNTSAPNGSTIKVMSGVWPANVTGLMIANQPKIVFLDGGYNADFTINGIADTVVEGGIVLRDGKVILKNIKIASISSHNVAPVANAGEDQIVTAGTLVALNGSNSIDLNGDLLTYNWTFTSKPAGSGAVLTSEYVSKPSFTADVAGLYVLNLVVSDGKVFSDPVAVSIYATSVISYTKIDSYGMALPSTASDWACTLDNNSGLLWEVKTDDGGLRDKDWVYTAYDYDIIGTNGSGVCDETKACNQFYFRDDVNAVGLCGYNDWRLPTLVELENLQDYGQSQAPYINAQYFPFTKSAKYWTGSGYNAMPIHIWWVDFEMVRSAATPFKDIQNHVRLVRP